MEKVSNNKRQPRKTEVNGLSRLEADILNIVWQHKKITVREVHETMLEDGYIPYTTIMASMNNMARKGLLKQNKKEKAFVYSAALSREETGYRIIDAVISRVLGGVSTPIIAHLLKVKEDDVEKLKALKDKLES